MIAWLLAEKIGSFLLIVGAGFALVKAGLVDVRESRGLSVITVYLLMPCVIIDAFQIDYTPEIRNGFLLSLAAAVVLHAVLIAFAMALGAAFKLSALERASIIFTNAGNLIIPIVASVIGDEYVIYASTFIFVQNMVFWTVGQQMMRGGGRINVRKLTHNVNVLSMLFGLALFLSGIRLPGVAAAGLKSLAYSTGPMCMLMIGITFGSLDPRGAFTSRGVYVISALRLVAASLICVLLLRFLPLVDMMDDGKSILFISMLGATAPSAMMVTQVAQLYNIDSLYSSAISIVTMLACVVTVPLMAALYYAI